MKAWYERFFDGLYGRVLARQFDAETTQKQARVVRRLLKARRGQHVLDVPCGQGRITLPLARAGLRMTGVDRTAAYVRKARRLARRRRLNARFMQDDMRELSFDGEFDAAFNWFGSFGYFSDADNLDFCRRVLRALKPGGRFLVEGINRTWVLAHFQPASDHRIGGVRVRIRCRWDARGNRMRATWRLERGGAKERHAISLRMFNGAKMRAFLRKAGFCEVRLFGPGGSRFTRHSRRLLAVAQKGRAAKRGCAR